MRRASVAISAAASRAPNPTQIANGPSLSAATQAAYQLAALRYDAGQHAAARSAYEIVLARGASSTLRTLAQAGIVPKAAAKAIRNGNAVVVVHGIDYNHNGKYDNVLNRSELDGAFPQEATAPALCGTLLNAQTARETG